MKDIIIIIFYFFLIPIFFVLHLVFDFQIIILIDIAIVTAFNIIIKYKKIQLLVKCKYGLKQTFFKYTSQSKKYLISY